MRTMSHKLKTSVLLGIVVAIFGHAALATQAQPVPVPEDPSVAPQIEISATGVGTAGYFRNTDFTMGEGAVNFSDSALQIGAAQKLYNGGAVGSFGLGWLTTDQTNKGAGQGVGYFSNQTFIDLQSESLEMLIGRTDNPTSHLVDFPTLREDDLITLTNPLNPFSNGENVEEHRYANTASVTYNQKLKFFENVHAQQLINSAAIGSRNGLNSAGATFQYLGAAGMEAFDRIPSWGIGIEHIAITNNSAGGLNQIYAGGIINLNESVIHRVDLRIQDIVSVGSDLRALQSPADSYQADSNALAMSLRYLNSPFGRPGYQIALTGGYKNYFKVDDARSIGVALTGVKRMGQGFDLVAQYKVSGETGR
jgi:hypothetical protein